MKFSKMRFGLIIMLWMDSIQKEAPDDEDEENEIYNTIILYM